MKIGVILEIQRYYDTSFRGYTPSMHFTIKRKTFFGRVKIDSESIYGYESPDLKVGDEVCYHFDTYPSKSYVIKTEDK